MTSCHLIPTWHEWNANAGDVMVTWFTSYVNLVMSQWHAHHACTCYAHVLQLKIACLSIQIDWCACKPTQTYGN